MNSRTTCISRALLLRLALSILLVLIVAVSLLVARLRQTPLVARGTPSGELTFVSNRDGNWDIFALDREGQVQNLSNDPAGDYFPSWALDSQQINFLSARSGEMGPTQMQPDGSGVRSLTILQAITTLFFEGRLDWDPHWSPDGARMAWASLRDLNLELYVMPNGGEPLRLTDHGGRDWFAAWSPDGTKLAFSSDRDGNENIYVIDAAGGSPRQLTDDPADDLRPVWSLDGQQILFVSERENNLNDGVMDLFIMNVDGSEQRKFDAAALTFTGGLVRSPDGVQSAYMANLGGRWHLYSRDAGCASDDCAKQLTDGEFDDLFPVWRP